MVAGHNNKPNNHKCSIHSRKHHIRQLAKLVPLSNISFVLCHLEQKLHKVHMTKKSFLSNRCMDAYFTFLIIIINDIYIAQILWIHVTSVTSANRVT